MRLITFVISIVYISNSYSQLSEPLVGKEYSTAKKENFSGFIGENVTTLFTADYLYLSRKKQELTIRKFHKSDLQLMDARNIYEDVLDDYYCEPIEIFYQNDKLFLFSNYFGEKEKTKLLALEIFNDQFEKLTFEIVDTMEIDQTTKIQESKEEDGFILVKYSKFSTLTEQEIDLTRIDGKGNVVWQELIKSPLALQNLKVEKIRFGKNTPIYVLCNYSFDASHNKLDDESSLINNKYAIWAYDREKHFLKEFEVRMLNKWVNGIQMEINENEDLLLTGFINETRYHSVNGVFSLVIDKMKVKNSAFHIFEKDIRKKFIEEKDLKKIKELEDYKLNYLSVLDDGSYFLTGEQYYKFVERSYDPRTNITTTTEHYNYNSIIVSYFDKKGNHIWTDCIPKFQNSTNDYGYYASFSVMNSGKEIFLFFNDTDKNNGVPLDDYFNYKGLFNNRRGQISFVQVGNEGVMKRGVFMNTDNNFMLRAKVCSQINDKTMYLLGETGRQARIFSVSLEE